jgi:hypothetical protein
MSSLNRSQSGSGTGNEAPPTQSLSHSNSSHQLQHSSSNSNGNSSNQSQQQQQQQNQNQQGQQAEDPVFGPLERAGKVLEERLARDDRWTGIGDSLSGKLSLDTVALSRARPETRDELKQLLFIPSPSNLYLPGEACSIC